MNETKFNGMGEIYAKFRPTYPKEFIDYLYLDVGINADSVIADIGSGTGILTKQILEKGNTVLLDAICQHHMRLKKMTQTTQPMLTN